MIREKTRYENADDNRKNNNDLLEFCHPLLLIIVKPASARVNEEEAPESPFRSEKTRYEKADDKRKTNNVLLEFCIPLLLIIVKPASARVNEEEAPESPF